MSCATMFNWTKVTFNFKEQRIRCLTIVQFHSSPPSRLMHHFCLLVYKGDHNQNKTPLLDFHLYLKDL